MSLRTAIQKVTKTVAAKLGKPVVYKRYTNGAYNPATGKAQATQTTENLTGVVSTYSSTDVRGSILAGDVRVDVATTDPGWTAPPTLNDFVSIDGVDYGIQEISPVYVQDSPVTYQLRVRR